MNSFVDGCRFGISRRCDFPDAATFPTLRQINAAFPVEDQDELLQAYGVSQPGSDRTAADRKPKVIMKPHGLRRRSLKFAG
eukprot:scaffold836_cov239-Pinguiococcus_pyrenoidosus.AAC.1